MERPQFKLNRIDLKLSDAKFLEIRDLIYERSGIFFPEGKLYLVESRLGRRVKELGMTSFEEYVMYLKGMINKNDELKKIYNLITINETYFFRYGKQLDAFIQKLLPEVIKKKEAEGKKTLKIWSSASSSGEELYTIAMLLKENQGIKLKGWKIELIGTDISQKILDDAKNAVYGKNSFRGSMNEYYKSKYFELKDGKYAVKNPLKDNISFEYLNLNEIRSIRKMRGIDFLFCRNVLIYFDLAMKKKVVRSFYDVINHGGHLFLGEAESLHGISSAFKVVHFPGAFVYWKE